MSAPPHDSLPDSENGAEAPGLPAAARRQLAQNLAAVRARIDAAARAADRDPKAVRLLAVTKSVPPVVAAALVELGQVDLGENRLPSLDAKRAHFAATGHAARWHYIGHVQRNKARKVLERSDIVHSVDTPRLLDAVLRLGTELELKPRVYLQVKLTDEADKHGLSIDELAGALEVARAAQTAGRLDLVGLMSMAPLSGEAEERERAAVEVFERTRDLAAGWPDLDLALSMGMTGDFEAAIRAGSTTVRIGSALFQGVELDAAAESAHG